MVEIGPGLSALTRPLLERLDHLTAVEIDRDLAARLRKQFEEGRLTVVEADALTVDFFPNSAAGCGSWATCPTTSPAPCCST